MKLTIISIFDLLKAIGQGTGTNRTGFLFKYMIFIKKIIIGTVNAG